ncbi:polysaccharide biosynthesis tyrosine autokinase [Aetokthonos hydrillicola Thurmond2011]|jgi:capsular exopolysaccharide synthesis family protein|uniref:non-specific protein-tyrosine kinase n=1 Tax=Aetokthonos hydrillicola Thurmond2011 TaxID=2712845 RepID=A0AAP5M5Y1_9CYAN|nr:polysaccharide biosynthesis tyrosine autokinase [Aetokthonos hydrillicola]MBO3460921.1 polysaccharide biosynthesis tyrosine autokinase [Aetokthonos hydrillicola CCALA 1050]MBW4586470.1 polysaccharide biosynthesis tyrosine autokinase [Aetokthonos hydrillicola CCALA 1050]MDR9893585.1 polysaccharide biosynthesis tyrosine autokinase [Aetokthonos hydrillicola Thurmond2011]
MEKGFSSILAVLKRRSIPAAATFVAVIGGAIAYLTITPHRYEASARLMLDDKRVSVSDLGRDLTQASSATPVGVSPLANQAELIKSQRVLERARQILAAHGQTEVLKGTLTTDDLSKDLKVKIVPATNILELSYQNKDPKLAAQVLNAVSQAMVEDNIRTISSEATKIRQFLQTEVPKARGQLLDAEAQENRYRQQSGLVSFEEQSKSLVESLAYVENQQRALESQLQQARSQSASLRQITDSKGINRAYATVRGGQDEQLKALRSKLIEVQTKLIEARMRFKDDSPPVKNLLDQQQSLRALYTQNLERVSPGNRAISSNSVADDDISQDLTSKLILNETERTALEKKLKLMKSEAANLRDRLAQLPIKQQPLTALTRHREEATASLKFLQSKLEEARITEAQKVSNVQVIERAKQPASPSSPKRLVVLTLASTFGAVLAAGVVLLLEMMDNTLRDASETEELVKLPVLGVLPKLPAKTLVLKQANQFLDNVGLVEPYRSLFKTLEFRSNTLRVIVVSSTISGEGKSIVASHLAAVSAMLSWRTLIIDADLRRPVQHSLFNLNPKAGLTDVIEGSKSLEEAVQPTNVENLDVLPSGKLHGRPSQFLESVGMKSLIEEASQEYDLVIIDTPPISACADAATLSRQSDGLLVVTRPTVTVKEMLTKCVSELTKNRIPVLGVVVNGMTSTTENYYRYPVNGYPPRNNLIGLGGSAKESFNVIRTK